ncbi:hypothetical protein RIEGSTA812A_PEG_438 [invertebrate metagenome]|uniref:Uncharacterized protein n=1 Tax=invertebrate metagenome TaxID=1711999 RepID=A0A484H6I5_9ZZZZ
MKTSYIPYGIRKSVRSFVLVGSAQPKMHSLATEAEQERILQRFVKKRRITG